METRKPARNWRSFVKEVGTIVLGVGIALAAQQAADWLHWQSDVKEARAALRAEMLANDNAAFARRIAIADCLEHQANEAGAILADLEAGRAPGKFTSFRTGSGSLIVDSEWQSQRASQTLTHFPHAELAPMSRYYDLIGDIRRFFVEEGEAWYQLGILQNAPRGITASDLIRLRTSLAIAVRTNHLIVLNARRQIRISEDMGITGIKADPVWVKNFCTLADADYARWSQQQQLR